MARVMRLTSVVKTSKNKFDKQKQNAYRISYDGVMLVVCFLFLAPHTIRTEYMQNIPTKKKENKNETFLLICNTMNNVLAS